ncbi:MAG TPA: aminotransferase class I/II-fold pyridoxal phosphate-dependent enzyme [Patescibacteria group bacterium]
MKAKKSLRVPYALSVYNQKEITKVIKVLKEHRTNLGKEVYEFEKNVAAKFGKKYGLMVNSGSSANLLATEILQLPEGSEIITPLLTFSTTIAPLIQKKLVPVFADVEEGTYQINVSQIEGLITKKTKALMIPLLLGNVADIKKLRQLANKYNLFLIEDSCDTLGATFDAKPTGSYTDISTTSFFGSHIITSGGNGGMIMVNKDEWKDRIKMLRGWGRSSSLFGETEDITTRFKASVDGIPYDAKFVFGELGYNFLPNEMCAAFGNEQFKKLPLFKKTREENFKKLYSFFKQYEELFILPKQLSQVSTQWLAFPLTIRKNAKFSRLELVTYLEKQNIQTRPIFTGNILRHPGFNTIPHKIIKQNHYITNDIMERGFLIGCHHGMEEKHINKIKNVFTAFLNK